VLIGLFLAGWMDTVPAQTERNVPSEFRLVGTYELTKRVKIRDGKPFKVAINPVSYEVYTDGITVRCYVGDGEAFTAFEIYRRDGIAVTRPGGLVESVPGVQAKTAAGDVLRQMSLTEGRMILSRFPALSDITEITYATRVKPLVQQ
jgi:hypothetical protein